jgi:hypothetical protein
MDLISSISEARSAKDQAKRELADVDGVVGIGLTKQGEGYAVKINLNHAVKPGTLPKRVQGVPLVVEIVGAITKRRTPA